MTRILGVGSPFGADRLAWQAIDYLARVVPGYCELLKLDRPESELLTNFSGADHVILMDAVVLDEAPGGVSLLDPHRLGELSPGVSSHGFGVANAIDLAKQLNQLPERLQIIGIHTGGDLSVAPELNTQALERLVRSLL